MRQVYLQWEVEGIFTMLLLKMFFKFIFLTELFLYAQVNNNTISIFEVIMDNIVIYTM